MSRSQFSYTRDQLITLSRMVIEHAVAKGATAADTEISEGVGQNVSVRQGEIETIEYNKDKGAGVTVYIGQRRGHASTSDLSESALKSAVEKALTIARYTAEDDAAGLPDADRLATDVPDLDLYHPWTLTVEEAAETARACEAAALAVDKRLTNSEGAGVSTHASHFIYANSLGFCNGYAGSRHGVSVAVIGEDKGAMQRDYWYSSARNPADLESAEAVGRVAGARTVRRLNGRKLDTRSCPVVFEAPIATGLIGNFVAAVSGGSLYRKSSFLLDSLGTEVFAPLVNIREVPFLPAGLGSAPFDSEGVACIERDIVRDGVVQGYFLSSYSARKLGMTTTGNAGGSHNLVVAPGELDLDGLLKKMGTGLLVTELLGQGANMVTGDYSRGAAGFWVENGEIQYPVEEITIAGNLKQMFKGIVAIGRDVERRGSKQVGSILIDRMTVAGN
ncbi:Zn-dependent protease, modulator of DNA gyrase [Thiobacillus denitrificans ATCC 25259]|uniref:Zn-dependent protease, modulator of DNA gyrase n=1 Tax=Thiobacillus denitrificans (strain ATCC 25259 / T1) TaxID=292415 RepID=Q3SGZ2_THIDA|nr:metalloprotease PmbA [Thiobacillus denitrificans]AAZ98101.1 Zn-dependent protease, modulator of DNA gyrase [Thiobacillus denitrificans ATCC 25259]